MLCASWNPFSLSLNVLRTNDSVNRDVISGWCCIGIGKFGVHASIDLGQHDQNVEEFDGDW